LQNTASCDGGNAQSHTQADETINCVWLSYCRIRTERDAFHCIKCFSIKKVMISCFISSQHEKHTVAEITKI